MKRSGKKIDKVFKIKYTVNLLPQVGEYIVMLQDQKRQTKWNKSYVNKDNSLTMMLSQIEDELELFDT